MTIRKIILSLFAFAVALGLRTNTLAGEVDIEGSGAPQLYVLKVHADWCGSCKALNPTIAQLKDDFSSMPVLFITLDVTDDESINQARLLASALGIEKTLKEHNKTGLVLLYDPAKGDVVKVLTKKNSPEEIATIIQEQLG